MKIKGGPERPLPKITSLRYPPGSFPTLISMAE
jgi:hypothetical protein